MCEAVVPASSPLNVTLTCIVLATVSITNIAEPVAGDPVGGTSSVPVRLATNEIESARAGGTDKIKDVKIAIAAKKNVRFIVYLPLVQMSRTGIPISITPGRNHVIGNFRFRPQLGAWYASSIPDTTNLSPGQAP